MNIQARQVGRDVAERNETGQHAEIDLPRQDEFPQRLGPFGTDGAAPFGDKRDRRLAAGGVKRPDVMLDQRNVPCGGEFPRAAVLRRVGDDQRRDKTALRMPGMVAEQRLGIGAGSAHEHSGPRLAVPCAGKYICYHQTDSYPKKRQ